MIYLQDASSLFIGSPISQWDGTSLCCYLSLLPLSQRCTSTEDKMLWVDLHPTNSLSLFFVRDAASQMPPLTKKESARFILKAWRQHRKRLTIKAGLKKLLKRQKVAAELLATEEVYLSSLNACLKVFPFHYFEVFILVVVFLQTSTIKNCQPRNHTQPERS